MSTKVEVLCPNGHRVNVKTTPNTKILQILEEACSKKGFVPTSNYELKHGRKTLDVTLSVRYAGLPNLARLELVKATKSRAESSVVIALQLESGQRLQHDFQPTTSLWGVLEHWQEQPEGLNKEELAKSLEAGNHPVCILMREEIIGEFALKSTTLRDLGLTTGRHIIRLTYRPTDSATLESIREKIESAQAKQEKLTARCSSMEETVTQTGSTTEEPMETSESAEVEEIPAVESGGSQQPQSSRGGARPKVDTTASQRGEAQLSPQGQVAAHEFFLPGVFPEPSAAERDRQKAERRREEKILRRMTPTEPVYPLQDFKFPEATKGQDLYHNELSDVNKEEYKPCDREPVVYNIDEIESPTVLQDEELPDGFFDVTEADVRSMWSSLQRQTAVDTDQPLLTQTLRVSKQEDKIAKYPTVTIRVNFPDKFVIQGLFRPRETVHALKKFVKQHLEDQNIHFYLYTAPPKCVLKDDVKSLAEADLVPLAVIYFGSETKREHYLSSAALAQKSTQAVADQVTVKHMTRRDGGDAHAGGSSSSTTGGEKRPSSNIATQGHAATGADGGKKVPKWFKTGK